MYIYGPTLIVCGMTAAGSNSSAIFVFLVLIGTMLIGGAPFKELFMAGAAVLVMAICLFGIHKATDGKFMHRMETFTSRMNASYETDRLDRYKLESREFYSARDSIKQPYGAKLAVHEGKLLGKGSGNSTQKYSVTHIYSDYMFSFLVEEYGLLGGILIIILYISLIARSSMIARLCSNEFARIAIGGLAFLITGQAFMHMLVNVDIMPMTGQTLPLISDGASAFLSSCLAFGIILSISRMAKKKTQTLEETVSLQSNDIQARMDILEQIDDANL
jgi:cell division protein FtsW